MAKESKYVVRSDKGPEVVFTGYGVTPENGDPKTDKIVFAKFSMQFPPTCNQTPDWVLDKASAQIWINEQSSLRKLPRPQIKALEGKVLDPSKTLGAQLTIDPDTALEIAVSSKRDDVEALEAMAAKIQALIDAKKAQ